MQATIDKFMGLRQDIDYPDLKLNYCHVLQNIDVDDPVGVMRVRDGHGNKYDDTLGNYPFTSLVSTYEYRFEVSSETVLIVNDNGTLKTMTDGGNPASLTLPTGATLESGFHNKYLGFKDHVLISAGNGATDYMLWYGYVDREADDDKGLFGNVEEFTGYKLLKSQLICPNGTFSNIYDTVHLLDGSKHYYYLSFEGSKYIEKRDSDFHLVSRFSIRPSGLSSIPADNANVALCKDSSGYIYAAYEYSTASIAIVKIDPSGWVMLALKTYTSGGHLVGGICTDGTMVYVAIKDASGGSLKELNVADLTENANVTIDDMLDVDCDNTASTGWVYVLKAAEVTRREKSGGGGSFGDVSHTNSDYLLMKRILLDTANSKLLVSSFTGDGHVYDLDPDNLTEDNDYENIDEPQGFINVEGSNWRGISTKYGTVEHITSTPTLYPGLVSINFKSIASGGSLDTGTYFYKISLIDIDGQEYTLSDPIVVNNTAASKQIRVTVIAHTDFLNDLYRVEYINIYRAWATGDDAEFPSTDYKFLKQIDINSAEWVSDKTDNEVYYFDYLDNTTEATVSTVTFLENSGIGDTVKPRHVNGKYFDYIGNKLHLANFSHDGETYRNRIIRSPDDQPDNIAFYDYYDYDVGDGEEIKGITNSYGRSVVFKNRKFRTFFNASPERDFVPGLSSDNGFTKVNEEIYFVSNQGLHKFDGGKVINLHYPVIKLFRIAIGAETDAAVFYVEHLDRVVFSIKAASTFIYNIKYGTWSRYTSAMAFIGMYKNYENEYIGWNTVRFHILFDSTYVNDAEDYGGGNGSAISIDYESPLILGNGKGNISILDTHRHRLFKGSDVLTLIVYDYTTTGRSSVATQALGAPASGADALVKTYFFNKVMGEAFLFKISGNVDGGDFKYYGMTLDYREGGLLYR